MKSSTFSVLCTGLILAGSFYASTLYRKYEEKNANVLAQHCANINADISRPSERECIYPIELDKKTFVFANHEGRVERYEIISTKSDLYNLEGNTFYYNFIGFGEK